MASNYSLRVGAKFKPYTFDELMAPFKMYGEKYDAQMQALEDMNAKARVYEDYIDEDRDPYAYARYNNFMNKLNDYSQEMAGQGLNPTARKSLIDFKGTYSSKITPIEASVLRRSQLEDEQRKWKQAHPNTEYQRDAGKMSLDEFILNPAANYGEHYDGDEIKKEVWDSAKQAAKQLHDGYKRAKDRIKYLKDMGLAGMYTILEDPGYNTDQIAKALLDRGAQDPFMKSIIQKAVQRTGVGYIDNNGDYQMGWGTKDQIDKAYTHATAGLPGGIGEDKVTFHSIPGYGQQNRQPSGPTIPTVPKLQLTFGEVYGTNPVEAESNKYAANDYNPFNIFQNLFDTGNGIDFNNDLDIDDVKKAIGDARFEEIMTPYRKAIDNSHILYGNGKDEDYVYDPVLPDDMNTYIGGLMNPIKYDGSLDRWIPYTEDEYVQKYSSSRGAGWFASKEEQERIKAESEKVLRAIYREYIAPKLENIGIDVTNPSGFDYAGAKANWEKMREDLKKGDKAYSIYSLHIQFAKPEVTIGRILEGCTTGDRVNIHKINGFKKDGSPELDMKSKVSVKDFQEDGKSDLTTQNCFARMSLNPNCAGIILHIKGSDYFVPYKKINENVHLAAQSDLSVVYALAQARRKEKEETSDGKLTSDREEYYKNAIEAAVQSFYRLFMNTTQGLVEEDKMKPTLSQSDTKKIENLTGQAALPNDPYNN